MAHRTVVAFSGEGSGEEELTWAQTAAWASMEESGTPESNGGAVPLPDGTTVEEVATMMRFLMSRHQSLRTRLRFGADGEPRQVVSASGELEMDVVDAGDDDPADVAESLRARYERTPVDYENEFPVRAGIVRSRGVPAYFVAMYPHTAVDGYGFDALRADLANLDRATGRALAPVAGLQPLDQARMQRTPAARRQSDASLRYWERQLRAIPPRRFGESADKRTPRYWEASYRSPAAHLALAVIAEQTKVHSGAIMLAAYGAVLGRLTGINPSVVRILVSNRFRPGLAESVCMLNQSGLCVFDVADSSFEEVVGRAWRGMFVASRHAYYDPRKLWDLVDRVGRERGAEFDLACYFNDRRRSLGAIPDAATVTDDQIRAAVPMGALRWGPRIDTPDASSYLHVNDVADTIDYTLRVDTHCVAPAELEACLYGIEEVLVEAALKPTMSTPAR